MPAFGAILILLGLWALLRTVRHNVPLKNGKTGGLVEVVLGNKVRPQEAGRRYLEASNTADLDDPDAKAAKKAIMAELERKVPGARRRAIVGTDQDFDRRLTPGLRAHQSHLREREGLTEGEPRTSAGSSAGE